MQEEWKDINGYEGYYQVSNLGRVKSLERVVICKNGSNKKIKEHLMSGSDNGNGYLSVMLCRNGKQKRFYIHRLVALAFIPNPNNLPEINHINEFRKDDNSVSNLEWISYLDNRCYGTRLARVADSQSFETYQYDLEGNLINTFYSIKEASRRTGVSDTNIGECCNGKAITAGGYIWRNNHNPNVILPENKHIKSVDQYDIKTLEMIKTYNTIKEAAEEKNITASLITSCCKRKIHTAGGYIWRYHGEELGYVKTNGAGMR